MSTRSLTEEELLLKHRRERKDLKNEIFSMKRACSVSDAHNQKEVMEKISRLVDDLDNRQTNEIEEFNSRHEAAESNASEESRRSNKAQNKRKKNAAEYEKSDDIFIDKVLNDGLIESEQIDAILQKMGLKLYSVPPDGNCLYCSVSHQLEYTGRGTLDVYELRQLTAEYLRNNKDDLLPFMSHPDDSDDEFTEAHFEMYCDKVENTPVWGGQIEIVALSNTLKCPIKIIQATTKATIQGEEYEGPALVLAYHRYLYQQGEHYNSTVVDDE